MATLQLTRRAMRPTFRASTRLFSTSLANRAPDGIDNLTVCGAGLMGAGIAQVAAQKGVKVTLLDVSQEKCDNGLAIIKKSMWVAASSSKRGAVAEARSTSSRVAKKAHPESQSDQDQLVEQTLSNLSTSTSSSSAVSSSDLVIEAIVENLSAKHSLFKSLDPHAPSSAIFASNTSSLKISDISSPLPSARQKQFLGLHFFNPVPQMKLVEVIRMDGTTDPDVVGRATQWCKRLGKAPANCKDTPGFIVNRLLVPYLLEAMRMAERGDASPEDIDTAMKYGAGVRPPPSPVSPSER